MKHIFKTVFAVLLAIVGVLACVFLYHYAIDKISLKPIAGYLMAQDEEPFIREDLLKSTLEQKGITLLEREEGETDAAALQRMVEAGARAVLIGQSTPNGGLDLMQKVSEEPVTLLFVGRHPSQTILSDSDKAWYLGSDSAHGGELLGAEAAKAFKSGDIPDTNQDMLLQVMTVGDSPLIDHALTECEHLGVYTEVLSYCDDEGNLLPFTAEGYAQAPKPELILCNFGSDARSARELAQELGWLDGEAPVKICCSAASKDGAASLREDGIVDLPVPYYDVDAVTLNAAVFIENALDFKFVSQGTDLAPNQQDRFILPYQVLE